LGRFNIFIIMKYGHQSIVYTGRNSSTHLFLL
jgi:hypothetical protein